MSQWLRFATLFLLFVGLPFGIAWLSLDSALESELEYRRSAEREHLATTLDRLACGIDPAYFLRKRFSLFAHRTLREDPPPAILHRQKAAATRAWGTDFDLYRFDRDGSLRPEVGRPPPFHRLLQLIWQVTIPPRGTDPGKAAREAEIWRQYEQSKPTLSNIFGPNFYGSYFKRFQDWLMPLRSQGRDGFGFWSRVSGKDGRGILLIAWKPPVPLRVLQGLFRKPQPYACLAVEGDGVVHKMGAPVASRTATAVLDGFQNQEARFLDAGGRWWTRIRSGDLQLFLGARPRDIPLSARRTPFHLAFLVLAGLGFWMGYRWFIQGRDFYLSIRLKLIALFLLTLSVPAMGVATLATQLLRHAREVETEASLRTARDALLNIDQEFQTEQRRILTFFRSLRNDPRLHDLPTFFADVLQPLHDQRRLLQGEVRAITGRVLARTLPADRSDQMETFARLCIERHLADRIAREKGETAPFQDFLMRAVIESPDSGFPFLLDRPDYLHAVHFGTTHDFFYWDVFREPDLPAAYLALSISISQATEQFLKRTMVTRTLGSGGLRLFAKEQVGPAWYPSTPRLPWTFEELMNRVRIGQQPIRDTVIWNGRPYLALGIPGRHVGDHGFLALSPEDAISRKLGSLSRSITLGLAVALLATLLTGLVLADTFLLPIGKLGQGIAALGDRKTSFRLGGFPRDELGDLSVAFNQMMENLDELAMGRVVQERLFPKGSLRLGAWSVAGLSHPAGELGGDYFDYMTIGDRYLLVVIGDVTGHGIPAALVMAMAKALTLHLARPGTPLEDLVTGLNTSIFSTMDRSLAMTAGIFLADTADGTAVMYNCGHPFPFRIRADGDSEMVKAQTCMPLGIRGTIALKPTPIALSPGERLVFYSDGLVESLAMLKISDCFGTVERLIVRQQRPDLLDSCKACLAAHPFLAAGRPLPDDFTLVILEFRP